MKILTLHLINHDANVTYYDASKKVTYLNLERVKASRNITTINGTFLS